jgi:putative chitinase
MIDRQCFFDTVRTSLCGGTLLPSQVDGMTAILDRAEAEQMEPRQLAYVLATCFHETARTMQPIAEYGRGTGKRYGRPDPETGQCFYGRGFVQITWKENYAKLQAACGERWGDRNQVTDPDCALDLDIATDNLFHGMQTGLFTGKKLADYITAERCDWINARRIVNALDCAGQIAGYAEKFYTALTGPQAA